MIRDLDLGMRRRGVDGMVGYGESTLADPDLTYVVGGTLPRGGFYFKKVGRSPLLIVSNLDYGSARRLGKVKRIQTFSQWRYEKLVRQHRDKRVANAKFVTAVLRHEDVKGNTILFGRNDLSKGLGFAHELKRQGVRLIEEQNPTVLETARDTKDAGEIDKLRKVAQQTSSIVCETIECLRNAKQKRGHLMVGRKRATVGLLKSKIAAKLAENDLVAPEGTIFATGPDGADPHNIGNPAAEIKKGKLIIFDIYPHAANGYWSDLTRTFMVGRADSRARRMFGTVDEAQSAVLDALKAGLTGEAAMSQACNVIESGGYRTVRRVFEGRATKISSGLTHSLGHGVGLTIGECPYLSFGSKDPLRYGEVVTVEPGIYSPNYGGVRIEDTVLIRSKGIQSLTSVEKELEIT